MFGFLSLFGSSSSLETRHNMTYHRILQIVELCTIDCRLWNVNCGLWSLENTIRMKGGLIESRKYDYHSECVMLNQQRGCVFYVGGRCVAPAAALMPMPMLVLVLMLSLRLLSYVSPNTLPHTHWKPPCAHTPIGLSFGNGIA